MTKNNNSIIRTVLSEAFHSILQQLYLFLLGIFQKKKKRGRFKCVIFHESFIGMSHKKVKQVLSNCV